MESCANSNCSIKITPLIGPMMGLKRSDTQNVVSFLVGLVLDWCSIEYTLADCRTARGCCFEPWSHLALLFRTT